MTEMPEPEALLEHRAFVRAIAKGLLRDDAAAEDVAQDAMLAATERPPRGDLRGWLAAVARNLSRMARRGERRRRDRELKAARPETVGPADEALTLIEAQRRVVEAVHALDEPYRTAIVLHYFHDLPVRQLAARLRVPKETARTRLRRGLALLRARLDGEYGSHRSWLPLVALLAADTRSVPVAGVVLMSAKLKVAVAAIVCILLTLVAVKWGGSGGSDAPPRAETPRTSVARDAVAVPPELPELPAPVDFAAVDRDRDLHGIVVDKAGTPIAGAKLQVVSYPWQRASVLNHDAYYDAVDGPETRSASDGTFSLRLRPGIEVALRASASGYAPTELSARQAGERVRVEMDAGARLTIVTRDEQGNPVPGTKVQLQRGARTRGVTDERGRCTLGTMPTPGVYVVEVMPQRLGHDGHETVTLSEPGDHEHVVTLVGGRSITGRVLDGETGVGIPNARVGIDWTMTQFVLSGLDGRYVVPCWIGKGARDIHCVADAHGRAEWIVDSDTHDFVLSRGDSVTGRLIGSDGRPVAGAPVSAIGTVSRRDDQSISTGSGESDAEGRFLLSGLRRDMEHTLVAMAQGHGRYLLDFGAHPEEPGTVDLGDIRLPAPRTIAGRLLHHDGRPFARVRIELSGCNDDRGRLQGGKVDPDAWYGTLESRHTDDLGRFRFTDLSPGTYDLSPYLPGTAALHKKVVLAPDADIADADLTLPEGRDFVVIVVDDRGAPVPRVMVVVDSNSGQATMTDATGRATFFVTGTVTSISANPEPSGRDLAYVVVPVERDESEFRLVLKQKATIAGTVREDDGQPVADALVAAKQGGRQVTSARTAADGSFTLDVPQGESFALEFVGVRGRVREYTGEPVQAQSGSTGVEIRVRKVARDRTLRVKVLLPDGSPAVGATAMMDRVRGETDSDGLAVLSGLSARESPVMAVPPRSREDVMFSAPQNHVAEGQEVTLRLRLAAAVSGVVAVGDDGPGAGAIVTFHRDGILCYSARSDAEGKFKAAIPADEPGPWVVRAALREKDLKGEVKDVMTGDAAVRIELK